MGAGPEHQVQRGQDAGALGAPRGCQRGTGVCIIIIIIIIVIIQICTTAGSRALAAAAGCRRTAARLGLWQAKASLCTCNLMLQSIQPGTQPPMHAPLQSQQLDRLLGLVKVQTPLHQLCCPGHLVMCRKPSSPACWSCSGTRTWMCASLPARPWAAAMQYQRPDAGQADFGTTLPAKLWAAAMHGRCLDSQQL